MGQIPINPREEMFHVRSLDNAGVRYTVERTDGESTKLVVYDGDGPTALMAIARGRRIMSERRIEIEVHNLYGTGCRFMRATLCQHNNGVYTLADMTPPQWDTSLESQEIGTDEIDYQELYTLSALPDTDCVANTDVKFGVARMTLGVISDLEFRYVNDIQVGNRIVLTSYTATAAQVYWVRYIISDDEIVLAPDNAAENTDPGCSLVMERNDSTDGYEMWWIGGELYRWDKTGARRHGTEIVMVLEV